MGNHCRGALARNAVRMRDWLLASYSAGRSACSPWHRAACASGGLPSLGVAEAAAVCETSVVRELCLPATADCCWSYCALSAASTSLLLVRYPAPAPCTASQPQTQDARLLSVTPRVTTASVNDAADPVPRQAYSAPDTALSALDAIRTWCPDS